MTRILVTGATGFIGRALVKHLRSTGEEVVALARRGRMAEPDVPLFNADLAVSGTLPAEAFDGVGAVIHLAGHAHTDEPRDEAGRKAVHAVNCGGALAVARAAAEAGARRFVFVSSATVHGPGPFDEPIGEDADLRPDTTYAAAKADAEAGLWDLARETSLEVCVIRPPLVYGLEAGGNFARILSWAKAGRPLPSVTMDNRRSMIGLTNLCEALTLAARHPDAAGRTFFVADQEELSTGEMYARLCWAFGRRPRFVPVPRPVLTGGLALLGRGRDVARLLGSYRLDTSAIRAALGWEAPFALEKEVEEDTETVAA